MKILLLKPVVTEKSSLLLEQNKYVFKAPVSIGKIEIKQFLKKTYGVDATQVNLLNQKGKARRRGKVVGVTPSKKKVIVTLKPGQKLELGA